LESLEELDFKQTRKEHD
jgi:hypothetical protein